MGKHRFHPNNLQNFLYERGLSQNRVAIECGLHQQRVNEWCLNRNQLPVWAAIKIGETYGVDPAYLLNLP